MRKLGLSLRLSGAAILFSVSSPVDAQSTFSQIYEIFQAKCVGCHNNINPPNGMSLMGTGADSLNDVYNTLVEQTPTNAYAAGQGFVRVNPGDPHSSLLFRKLNQGFDAHMVLDTAEGVSMPKIGAKLDYVELELIRQWILYGAPETGTVVDTSLIQAYYANGGIESMPTQPSAPAPGEGIQIHFGPYFVPPSSEQEYYMKFDPGFTDTLESNRVDMLMGNYSHHFIVDRFLQGNESNHVEGLRLDAAHTDTEGITATQYSDSVFLPQNTAFLLPANSWLDLNSHYINFSATEVLKAEVYINIHTQTYGTAKQIMYSGGAAGALTTLYIPNDGASYPFSDSYYDGTLFQPLENDIFVWSMTSHTHQWGTDFDIYKRTSTGGKGEKLFDASNVDGMPNGINLGYFYAEPPSRIFDPFLFTPKNEGFIYEASYVNTGPNPVGWGLTSEDEMFIMGIFYVLDTVGLSAVSTPDAELQQNGISVYPNPSSSTVHFRFDEPLVGTIEIYNSIGKLTDVIKLKKDAGELDASSLAPGIYYYRVMSEEGVIPGRFTVIR